ncbi:hypothetical protein [Natronobiforma cellulositropha]|uniref:hypothetical protein n=1 Tax=Natronobiforma cellulositropha TaxID=1679076 RepID=UPI0021D5ADD8|nr:hypothetical protein [Natronobiforma cellulositropha]
MADASYRCVCGAPLRFKQDLEVESTTTGRRFRCRDCATPVPGIVGERLVHQHPS